MNLIENSPLESAEVQKCKESSSNTSVAGTPEGDDWRLFKPRIDDDGTTYELLRQVLKENKVQAIERLELLIRNFADAQPQALRVKVSAALLRDLLCIGWEFHVNAHSIYVRPPKTKDLTERKESIRQQLLFGRNDQLSESSNRRFIFSMERPSKFSAAKPITELIADGRRLAEQLEFLKTLPKEEQLPALNRVCSPYLQLVSDERDEFTKIRLIDIWRYFRHSWSTRYRSSPGRNLFYFCAWKYRNAIGSARPHFGMDSRGLSGCDSNGSRH